MHGVEFKKSERTIYIPCVSICTKFKMIEMNQGLEVWNRGHLLGATEPTTEKGSSLFVAMFSVSLWKGIILIHFIHCNQNRIFKSKSTFVHISFSSVLHCPSEKAQTLQKNLWGSPFPSHEPLPTPTPTAFWAHPSYRFISFPLHAMCFLYPLGPCTCSVFSSLHVS